LKAFWLGRRVVPSYKPSRDKTAAGEALIFQQCLGYLQQVFLQNIGLLFGNGV
jgi:hypothetical protein